MKTSQVVILLFFAIVFQNCKSKKTVFNNNEIYINKKFSYNNTLNYNSITYNNTNQLEFLSDSSNKSRQVQLKTSLKQLNGFTTSLGKEEHEKVLVTYQKENERIKTGPIKTIRKGFVIVASVLLIAAIVLLFFALLKWQSIYLLWSLISAGISYLLFKLGKKRLKTDWIEADRKQLKQLKKAALLVGLISGFIYLITLVF